MCLGAIYWARLARVLFAATRADATAAGFDDSLIYNELQLPYSQRKIPMISMMHSEAQHAFAEWNAQAGKSSY
jgi:tRNA(Arg) A34 adenosine deaminase TadA